MSISPTQRSRSALIPVRLLDRLGDAGPAALVGLFSLVLGLITLGDKAYQYDEAFNIQRTHWTWSELYHLIRYTEENQALYLFGLKSWAGLDSSESFVRLLSVFAAALAAALLVKVGEELFDRRTGVVAGLLLASNAFVVMWSQIARTYTLATLATVITTLLLMRALARTTWASWIVYAVAAGLAVYTDFYVGFVILAQALTVLVADGAIRRKQIAVCGALFLVIAADALRFAVRAPRFQVEWIPQPSAHLVVTTIERVGGWNWLALLAASIGAVLIVRASLRGSPSSRQAAVLIVGWAALPLVLGLVVSEIFHPIFIARYAIVVSPALALLAAFALSAAWDLRREVGIVAAAAIVGVSAYRVVDWYTRVPEDWRGAAGFIERTGPPPSTVSFSPPWASEALEVYLPGSWRDPDLHAKRRYVVTLSSVNVDPVEHSSYDIDRAAYHRVESHRFGERLAITIWDAN